MPIVSEESGPDDENPEWTAERMKRAMRFSDLPAEMQRALAPNKRRGPQKAPTKQLISIRLSPDVLEALRAKGQGWQALADEALRAQFVKAK